jgi:hypothetical protein
MSKKDQKKDFNKDAGKKDKKQDVSLSKLQELSSKKVIDDQDEEESPYFGSMASDFEPLKVVKLKQDHGSETLDVEIVAEVEMDGKLYGLVTPAQPIVYILEEEGDDDDSELQQIAPEDFAPIQKQIQEALSQWNVHVEVRADEFVLVGDPPEEFYSESELFEAEDDEGESVEYMILVEVDDGSKRYLVTMPIDPVLYPVELLPDDTAIVLEDDKMGELHDIFQNIMEGMAQGDDDEDQ